MKKSFKKAGAAVLSMAMLLSMGAISMPVYADEAKKMDTNTGKPATVTFQISGLTDNPYFQGEGASVDMVNGDGSDSDAQAASASHSLTYKNKYDYWNLSGNQGLEGAKVTMYRVAQLTPGSGWQWEDYINEFRANNANEQLLNFTDFADLMKNKDLDPEDDDNATYNSSVTDKLEFNTPSETLKNMASYFERIIESLKSEQKTLLDANITPSDAANATDQQKRLKKINDYLASVTVASREFGNDAVSGTSSVVLPTTDVELLDKNKNGVLDDDEIALTQNVIGYYLIVTETEQSGTIVQPILVCLKNGENKYVSAKGTKISFEKTMTEIVSGTETDSEDAAYVKKNADPRFSSTEGTNLKNGLVAKDDVVKFKITSQLPKYDTNVSSGNIAPFTITDTASNGLTFDIPVDDTTHKIDDTKFKVFLVDATTDIGADGTLADGKGWELQGSTIENAADYQLTKNGTHGFTITINGYQMREVDASFNASGQDSGGTTRTRGYQAADGVVDDINLIKTGTSSEPPTAYAKDSMTLATRTNEENHNYGKLASMENKYIYVYYEATVNKDANGEAVTDEENMAFDRSFKEYKNLEDVTTAELADSYLAGTGTTTAADQAKDVQKQILRVQLFNGETRYNQNYDVSDYSDAEFRSYFLTNASGSVADANLNDKGKALKAALGEDTFNALFDVYETTTEGTTTQDLSDTNIKKTTGDNPQPVVATDNTNNRIRLLLARDKFNITRNGEYNTAYMTYGNRYSTGGGEAQMNTNCSKVYSVDLELSKWIEIDTLEGTPEIQKNTTAYGAFAADYVRATNPKTITINGTTFTLADIKTYDISEVKDILPDNYTTMTEAELETWATSQGWSDTSGFALWANTLAGNGGAANGVTADNIGLTSGTITNAQKAVAYWYLNKYNTAVEASEAYTKADSATSAAGALENTDWNDTGVVAAAGTGGGVDRVTGETITGDGNTIPDSDSSVADNWNNLTELQKKVLALQIKERNSDDVDYASTHDKQPVVGAIFHLVRNYKDNENADKVVDLGYAISTTDGELQKLEIVQGPQDTAITSLPQGIGDNEQGYIFQNEEGKYLVGKISVTKDANGKVTAFGGDKTWRMLDVGEYTVYEVYVPTGYKKWDSATFEITADQEPTEPVYLQKDAFLGSYAGSADIAKNPSATSSSGFGSIAEQKAGTGKAEFVYNKATGTLSQDLYNEYLDQLPATGGMGTVLFTAGGISVILVAGALFVMYMKKRNNEEEE